VCKSSRRSTEIASANECVRHSLLLYLMVQVEGCSVLHGMDVLAASCAWVQPKHVLLQ
jgi:hypothetical protein